MFTKSQVHSTTSLAWRADEDLLASEDTMVGGWYIVNATSFRGNVSVGSLWSEVSAGYEYTIFGEKIAISITTSAGKCIQTLTLREWSFFNNRRVGIFLVPPTGGVKLFLSPPSGRLKLSTADPFEL